MMQKKSVKNQFTPSVGGKDVVIANVFVPNFPNKPSQYHKAIVALRFQFWEGI